MKRNEFFRLSVRLGLLSFTLASCASILCRPAAAQDAASQSPSQEITAASSTSESAATNAQVGGTDVDSSVTLGSVSVANFPTIDFSNAVAFSVSNPFPGSGAGAQTSSTPAFANGPDRCDLLSRGLVTCFTNILHDQVGIWSSPAHVHRRDVIWILPVAAAAGVALAFDNRTLATVSTASNTVRISNDFSNATGSGYALGGAAVAIYAIGKITHNERARETGMVALEALVDAGIADQVLKLAFDRYRPDSGAASGKFWPDSATPGSDAEQFTTNGSFPSGHSMAAWAVMHVLVEETPGHRWLHVGLYALATGVSISRVIGRDHFPSDVLVGGTLGYLIGGYVYRQRSQFYVPHLKAVSIAPIYNAATRTYGASVSITP